MASGKKDGGSKPAGWYPFLCRLGRLIFKFFGIFCVTVAWALILGVIYIYYSTVVPLMVDVTTLVGLLLFAPSSWISFNLIFNYALVLWTSPGRPAGALTEEEITQMQRERVPEKGKGWSKFCKHCKLPKPPRAHHCHLCGHCVLKMDHHCPWINACVGHFNHRYFVLFVFYLALACLFACVTLTLHYFGFLQSPKADQQRGSSTALMFTFVICAAVLFAMLLFFGWNSFLILTNQTTIEYHFNSSMKQTMSARGEIYVNPYDVGITRNLLQVFGPFKSYWAILLPSRAILPGDGTQWLTVDDPYKDIL